MAKPRSKARTQPGSLVSRQRTKLNSQRAQTAPITPVPKVGPRRQLPPSSQGSARVGNSSQPWGPNAGSGQRVQPVRVSEVGRPQLPPGQVTPPRRQLPGMQGPQPAPRPSQPGTSRPPAPTRRQAAETKLSNAARGTSSSTVRVAGPTKPRIGPRQAGGIVGTALTIGPLLVEGARRAGSQEFWNQKAEELRQRRDGNQPKTKPGEKSGPPAPTPEQVQSYRDARDVRHMSQRAALQRDFPTTRNSSGGSSGGGGGSSSGGSGGGSSRPAASSAPAPKRFTGTVEEGRRLWAEKYSSDKYKGQAIHKEAKAYMDKLKTSSSSSAPASKSNAGAGANAMSANSKALENNTKATPFNTDKLQKRKGQSYGTARA